jgi:SAM-dependent methyltransferase
VSNPELSYSGLDILQALERATNYNALLLDLILTNGRGRRRMLDFGAGIGTFSKLLRKKGIDVVCVEPDVYLSDALIREGFPTLRDLEQVPDASFEFIFTLNVLEHIEDDQTTVRRLGAKLKKGGRLLIYVPAFELLWTSLDDKLRHYRRYRRAALESLARAAGLSVVESRYVDSLGFFATLGFKFFGDKHGAFSVRGIALYDRYIVPPSRALDSFLGQVMGKNVCVIASKDHELLARPRNP